MTKKKRPGLFEMLFGSPREDFRLRVIPELIDGAKKSNSRKGSLESTLSDEEFRLRYRNVRLTYMAVAVLALFSLSRALFSDLWLNQLGALLAGVIMLIYVLKFGFQLWVARRLYRLRNSRPPRLLSDDQLPKSQVTFSEYLVSCMASPRELLPLSLPQESI